MAYVQLLPLLDKILNCIELCLDHETYYVHHCSNLMLKCPKFHLGLITVKRPNTCDVSLSMSSDALSTGVGEYMISEKIFVD